MAKRSQDSAKAMQDFERYLEREVALQLGSGAPGQLAAAVEHAVFEGAGRMRPALGLALAAALELGTQTPAVHALCAAVELLHCASLVHDDLPCFDDAQQRRGRPSVHARFGQAMAVLTGDALIAMAFAALARPAHPHSASLVSMYARAVGPCRGLVAGQAMEFEQASIHRDHYHDAKTGALFECLCEGLALLAGIDPMPEAQALLAAPATLRDEEGPADNWRLWGRSIGRIYQRCDDLADLAHAQSTGKTPGQDARHARPNWAQGQSETSVPALLAMLQQNIAELVLRAPACAHIEALEAWALLFSQRVQGFFTPSNAATQGQDAASGNPAGLDCNS